MTSVVSQGIDRLRQYGLTGTVRKGWARAARMAQLTMRDLGHALWAGRPSTGRQLLARTTGEWASLDALVEHLCAKPLPAGLFPAAERARWTAILRARYPQHVAAVLEDAERACAHRFAFLGHEVSYDGEIDWHLDPPSGARWPRVYHEKFDEEWHPERWVGDIKLPWELGRHQYWVTLGQAYWISGDERYAEAFVEQLLSWIRQNPVGRGRFGPAVCCSPNGCGIGGRRWNFRDIRCSFRTPVEGRKNRARRNDKHDCKENFSFHNRYSKKKVRDLQWFEIALQD